MPLYEYTCANCGRFEVIQKFSNSPLTTCPRCGKAVEKLPSAPAIQFKGTGWYITDYARKPSGGDGGPKGAEKKDSAPTPSSKDETSSTPKTSTSNDSAATGSSSTK